MPLWLIYHPAGTLETETEKAALAQSITKLYTDVGLPAFYVVVNFVPLPKGNVYVGGVIKADKPFIRFVVDQIAVRMDNNDATYANWTAKMDQALKPHVAEKGYDWEYHVDETERRLWKINGLYAPPFRSEEEKAWFNENKPLPWGKL